MKNKRIYLFLIILVIIDIIAFIFIGNKGIDNRQDSVEVNRIYNDTKASYSKINDLSGNSYEYSFSVIDLNDKLLFNYGNASMTFNEGVLNRDTILDVIIDDKLVAHVLVFNNQEELVNNYRNEIIGVSIGLVAFNFIYILGLTLYLNKKVISPFKKMESFAIRIAGGDLDTPLDMDKENIFGAFTESFDIMRNELKESKIKEREALESKKELIAKLSHDIKTPVASIKASSELGVALDTDNKFPAFKMIGEKADQINSLVNNLFESSLEEISKLSVNPTIISSMEIVDIIKASDYKERIDNLIIPECLISADKLRLEQVFDNVISNSYKYADSLIEMKSFIEDGFLFITLEDYGQSANVDEIPLLKQKFKRGSNSINKTGAGLGLYLCDLFMDKMDGSFNIDIGEHGFLTIISIKLAN